MPTAPKLVAAVIFAIVGFFTAEFFKPQMPEGTQFGQFSLICAAIGLISGWRVIGSMTGKGYSAAVGLGVRTSATFLFFALLGFCIYVMVLRSMNMRYDGPMEAVIGVFELILEHGALLATPQILGTLIGGGILGGLATEWASRRWT